MSPRIEIPGGFYLSRIQRTDKAAYLKHFTDPEIATNTLAIPFPYTEADADAWLDLCEKEACEPEKNFAIREAGGYLIGGIGIHRTLPETANEAEFGYWLAKSFWGSRHHDSRDRGVRRVCVPPARASTPSRYTVR